MGLSTALMALGLFAAAPAPNPEGLRVAAFAIDQDPADAGSLQAALEARIAALPAVRLVAPVGPGLLPAPETVDLAATARLETALKAAYNDYYDGKLDRAIEDANAAARIAETSGAHAKDHIRISFWLATVYLDRRDVVGADQKITDALALDRNATVDLGVYPPSLQQAVERVRPTVRPAASILLTVPAGATALLDDHPAAGRIALVRGTHWISVSAPGYRRVDTSIAVADGQSLTVPVPLAPLLAPEDAAALAWLAQGHASEEDARGHDALARVAALARRAGADAIVAGVDSGNRLSPQLHGFVWRRDSLQVWPQDATASLGIASLTQWVTTTLTPAARVSSSPRTGGASLGGWAFDAGGAATADVWSRRVTGGVSTTFAGVGPELDLTARNGGWIGRGRAGFSSYALSSLKVSGDGGSSTARGGTGRSFRLAAGRRFGGPDRRGIELDLAFEHDGVDAVSASSPAGGLLLLPSFTRDSLELDGSALLPLARPRSSPVWLSLDLAAIPVESYRESPSGATGRSPRPGPGFGAGASIAWSAGSRSSFALGWHAVERSIRFRGSASASYDPPLADASVLDLDQRITASLAWRIP